MANRSNIAKGDDRFPAKALNHFVKGISDHQWAMGHARGALITAKQSGEGLTGADRIAELEQGIEEALAYLFGEKLRPDPEPGEKRLWHEPHEVGDPCWFHKPAQEND